MANKNPASPGRHLCQECYDYYMQKGTTQRRSELGVSMNYILKFVYLLCSLQAAPVPPTPVWPLSESVNECVSFLPQQGDAKSGSQIRRRQIVAAQHGGK